MIIFIYDIKKNTQYLTKNSVFNYLLIFKFIEMNTGRQSGRNDIQAIQTKTRLTGKI